VVTNRKRDLISAISTLSETFNKEETMAKSMSKPTAKRVSGTSGSRKPTAMSKKTAKPSAMAKGPGNWREETLARMRALILEADPEIVEERKWKKPSNAMAGVPVWSHGGIVCTGETYAKVVKLTFARGASLEDPHGLFNSSLEGGTRRAIDIREGEVLDAKAFKALIQAAVEENLGSSAQKTSSQAKPRAKAKTMPASRRG
jgi:hypothetical protein